MLSDSVFWVHVFNSDISVKGTLTFWKSPLTLPPLSIIVADRSKSLSVGTVIVKGDLSTSLVALP